MNLLSTIKLRLEHINYDELLRTMKYRNLKIGHLSLQKFLATDNIYLFMKNGHYDFKYTSNDFLHYLLKSLDLITESRDEITRYKKRLNAIQAIKHDPYIFIDTHFKRKGESILLLSGRASLRTIKIDKETLVFKSKLEVFTLVSNIVKKHYAQHQGILPLWGEIHSYIYYHADGCYYTFK